MQTDENLLKLNTKENFVFKILRMESNHTQQHKQQKFKNEN